jgi:NAD-dependent deacetylase sirtuin 2
MPIYCYLTPSSPFLLQNEDYAEVLARFKELVALKETTSTSTAADDQPPLPRRLSSFDLAGIAELISSGQTKRIVCMCGAGISVNAGIPDFRSPGTGLYSRLAEYGLPHPQAVFEIDYFKTNPKPFFHLAKELYPGTYAPTPTHHFLKLLDDKGLLLRCYTQNIDSLECIAGVPRSQVIAAHGNFDSARCIECKTEHEVEFVREAVFAQEPCYCAAGKAGCSGLVKPDIVFFGENLPKRFWNSMEHDLPQADLLIVVGTSLVVQPFASLIDKVGYETPRLLINKERVGEADPVLRAMGYRKGFDFGAGNTRDALFEGDCDSGVWELCQLLGWEEELRELVEAWEPPEEILKFKRQENAATDK